MGIREAFSQLFKKQGQEPPLSDKLGKLGLDIHGDEKLAKRIALLNALHDAIEKPITTEDPLKRLTIHRGHMQAINRAMKIVSVPYGRAGDANQYREAMLGWEMLYALGMDVISTVETMVKSTAMPKNIGEEKGNALVEEAFKINVTDLVRKLEGFLQIEIYPYGFLIMDVSYYGQDVAASYATVVQSLTPPRSQGIDVNQEADRL